MKTDIDSKDVKYLAGGLGSMCSLCIKRRVCNWAKDNDQPVVVVACKGFTQSNKE